MADHINEEVLSYFIENNPTHSIAQKVIQLVRKALRLIGRALPMLERGKWIRWANTLSEGDIISMATSALRQAPDALVFDSQASDNTIRLAYEQGIDEVLNGKGKGALKLGNTLAALTQSGIPDVPLMITEKVVDKAHYDHGLTKKQLKDLPNLLANPLMVFHSDTQPGSFVVITHEYQRSIPIMVAIKPNGEVERITPVNVISSAYGKPVGVIEGWIKKGLLISSDRKAALAFATTNGLQLPAVVQSIRKSLAINIDNNSTPVKHSTAKKVDSTGILNVAINSELDAANDSYDKTDIDLWSGDAYDYIDNDGFKVGTINKKLEAMIAQYAAVDGKPSRAEMKEAVDQYRTIEVRYFNKDGSLRKGAMLAPNGKSTHLTEQQWIQSKTENFRKWFGDSVHVDENGEPAVIDNGENEVFVNDIGHEKLATGNTGTFKRDSNDIRFSRANPITNAIEQGDDWLKSFLSQERKDSVIYNLQDRFIDLKRQMEKAVKDGGTINEESDPYLAEELYHQRTASRIKDFYDHEINPVLKGLHDNKISLDEFQKLLHARHAPSRNAVMAERNPNQEMIDANLESSESNLESVRSDPLSTRKEIGDALAEYNKWKRAKPFDGNEEDRLSLSGMSNEEAADIIDSLTPEQKAIMEPLADKVDAINNKTLDLLVEYGMETEDSVQALKEQWEHYVPLHRDEAHPDENNFGHPVGRGFSVRGSGIKNATGSNAEVQKKGVRSCIVHFFISSYIDYLI